MNQIKFHNSLYLSPFVFFHYIFFLFNIIINIQINNHTRIKKNTTYTSKDISNDIIK